MVALVGDGRVVVTLASGRVRWAIGDEQATPLGGPQAQFHGAVFSADGALLVDTFPLPGRVLSTATTEALRELSTDSTTCGSTRQFAADGRHLLTFGSGDACVIDTESGAVVLRLPQQLWSLGWRDGFVVGATPSGEVLTFDAQGNPVRQPDFAFGSTPRLLFISPNGERIAGYDQTGTWLVDAVSGAQLASYPVESTAEPQPPIFSPDGAFVLLGDRVLVSESGHVARSLAQLPLRYAPASLANDGRRLGIVSRSFSTQGAAAQVMDVESGRVLRVEGGYWAPVLSLAVAPDGKHVVTSSMDRVLGWRIGDAFGETHLEWVTAASTALQVRYSPDGSLITVSGEDPQVLSADGRLLFRPPAPPLTERQCPTMGFAVSPDNRWLVGTSSARQVDVFDLATQKLVASLPSSSCRDSVAFSRTGELLLTSVPELYSTRDWSRLWPTTTDTDTDTDTDTAQLIAGVTFMPGEREALVSSCNLNGAYGPVVPICRHDVYTIGGRFVKTLPDLTSGWPDFAADGDIIVSGARWLYRPLGRVMPLGFGITAAAFTPNGDIIAGDSNGALRRMCRY